MTKLIHHFNPPIPLGSKLYLEEGSAVANSEAVKKANFGPDLPPCPASRVLPMTREDVSDALDRQGELAVIRAKEICNS